jgi:hypothetical protein
MSYPTATVVCEAIEAARTERTNATRLPPPAFRELPPDDEDPDGPDFNPAEFAHAMRVCQARAPEDRLFKMMLNIGEGLERRAVEYRLRQRRKAA